MNRNNDLANPRLEAALRQAANAGDLRPDQNQRVRERLGLTPQTIAGRRQQLADDGGWDETETQHPIAIDEERPRIARQWLQIAAATLALVAVGLVLALLFRGGGNGQPSIGAGPTAAPTPDMLAGAVSLEEAQSRLTFGLLVPDQWPEPFQLAGVQVFGPESASLMLNERDGSQSNVTVTQMMGNVMAPDAVSMQQNLLESYGEPIPDDIPESTQGPVTIAGREVLLTTIHDIDGKPLHTYSWQQGEVHVDVGGQHRPASEIEPVVAAIAALPDGYAWQEPAPPEPTNATAAPLREVTSWSGAWTSLSKMRMGPDGNLYVNDFLAREILVYSVDGTLIRTLSYSRQVPAESLAPNDFAVGPDGRIFVQTKFPVPGVLVLSQEGELLHQWSHGIRSGDPPSNWDPNVLAIAGNGDVFLGGRQLHRFTTHGEPAGVWDAFPTEPFEMYPVDMIPVDDGLLAAVPGSGGYTSILLPLTVDGVPRGNRIDLGRPEGQGVNPNALAVAPDGLIYVVDVNRRQVLAYSADGTYLGSMSIESPGADPIAFMAIATDAADRVYVADDLTKTVYVYEPTVSSVPTIPGTETTPTATTVPSTTWYEPQVILSPEEAQHYVGIDLLIPDQLPARFTLIGVDPSGPMNPIVWVRDVDGRLPPFGIMQTTGPLPPYDPAELQEDQKRLRPPGSDLDWPPPYRETLSLGGREVEHLVIPISGLTRHLYMWTQGEVAVIVDNDAWAATILEELVASIAELPDGHQRAGGPPPPAPVGIDAVIESRRAAMIPYPAPASCQVSSWYGPFLGTFSPPPSRFFIEGTGLATEWGVLYTGQNGIVWTTSVTESTGPPSSVTATLHDSEQRDLHLPVEATKEFAVVSGLTNEDTRSWYTTVTFPAPGCWDLQIAFGPEQTSMARVYVYPAEARPPHDASSDLTVDQARDKALAALLGQDTGGQKNQGGKHYQEASVLGVQQMGNWFEIVFEAGHADPTCEYGQPAVADGACFAKWRGVIWMQASDGQMMVSSHIVMDTD